MWDKGFYYKAEYEEGELGKQTHSVDFWSSAGHLPLTEFGFPDTFNDPSKIYSQWLNTVWFHC